MSAFTDIHKSSESCALNLVAAIELFEQVNGTRIYELKKYRIDSALKATVYMIYKCLMYNFQRCIIYVQF